MRDARVEIEVVVRLSPASNTASKGVSGVQVKSDGGTLPFSMMNLIRYAASSVLDEKSTEDDVFDTVGASAVQWFWDGFNTAIIANGESGSGKTYTLHGNNFGLCGMILASIFHRRQTYEDPSAISVALSCWECRGENLVDLLADNSYEMSSKRTAQFDFVTLHAADLRAALDILKSSRRRSVNWLAEGHYSGDTANDDKNIAMAMLPNEAHGFIRIVLHNALDMRASTMHIVDCIGEDTNISTSVQSNSNAVARSNKHDRKSLKQNAIVAKQLLSFRRLIDELCSHKRNSSGKNEMNQGSGVLTSSRETLLNKFIAPLIAGNCKSYLLLAVPSLISNVSRTKNLLKSYCAASGIRCACVRLLDVQLQDLNFVSPGIMEENGRLSPRLGCNQILNQSQRNPLQGPTINIPSETAQISSKSSSPKPVWSPSGSNTRVERKGKN